MPAHLFVYGTLMFPAVFRAVTGTEPRTMAGTVRGYARRCVVGKSYPVLVEEAGQYVEGKLCLDVSNEALALLDAYEGVAEGLYCRRNILVETEDGSEIGALTYTAGPYLGAVGELWRPADNAMETYLTEEVAPFLERCRISGTVPVASTIL